MPLEAGKGWGKGRMGTSVSGNNKKKKRRQNKIKSAIGTKGWLLITQPEPHCFPAHALWRSCLGSQLQEQRQGPNCMQPVVPAVAERSLCCFPGPEHNIHMAMTCLSVWLKLCAAQGVGGRRREHLQLSSSVWQHQTTLHLDQGPFLSRATIFSCHFAVSV